MTRLKQRDLGDVRKGGVIWHTQGSGKSLTMVMLGRCLALDKEITNPRIIIVTDRDDLDRQIKGTFKSCELEPIRSRTGAHLAELIEARAPLVTTIINKFSTAIAGTNLKDESPDIFVLVDESHRTQTGRYGGYGDFAKKMRRMLPKACYLGFTGTPLLKSEKNTLHTFGGLIHKYTIDEAVADEAVVPLLYEGRLVEQEITGKVIDKWFEKITAGLTDQQIADLIRQRLVKRAPWVLRQVEFFRQFHPKTPERTYQSGETHIYLGRRYRLKVIRADRKSVKLTAGHVVVSCPTPSDSEAVRALVQQWQKAQARRVFDERLAQCLSRFPNLERVRPKALIVRQLKQRWGSMSLAGRLVLNRSLVQAAVPEIDYVVTHELCHRIHHHHGPKFFELLERMMPDWQTRKATLERRLA